MRIVRTLTYLTLLYMCWVVSVAVASQCSNAVGDSLPQFADLNETCNNSTMPCKNFLSCINSTCVPVPKNGDPCDPSSDHWNICGGGYLRCNPVNKTCDPVFLDNGDPCNPLFPAACASGHCLTSNNTCVGTYKPGDACDVSNYTFQCLTGQFCLSNSNGTQTCQPPRAIGDYCLDDLKLWEPVLNANLPESAYWPIRICEGGAACLYNTSDRSWAICTQMYMGEENDFCLEDTNAPSAVGPASLYCRYNLSCEVNQTNANSSMTAEQPQRICTAYASKTPKNCSLGPPEFFNSRCKFGDSCNCGASGNVSHPQTCQPYIGGDVCEPILESVIKCMTKHGCAYRAASLLDRMTLFIGPTHRDTCSSCYKKAKQFLCCQNIGFGLSGIHSPKKIGWYSYTPANAPGKICNGPTLLASWIIPVIVLGGIVVVIAGSTFIYMAARWKKLPSEHHEHTDTTSQYQPLGDGSSTQAGVAPVYNSINPSGSQQTYA